MHVGGCSAGTPFLSVYGDTVMKKLLVVAVLGMFSAALIGCEASAEVDEANAGTTVRHLA